MVTASSSIFLSSLFSSSMSNRGTSEGAEMKQGRLMSREKTEGTGSERTKRIKSVKGEARPWASNSPTQPQTQSLRLKWKMRPLPLIWAPTVPRHHYQTRAQAWSHWTAGSGSAVIITFICYHRPSAHSNQAKSIFTRRARLKKNATDVFCIVLSIMIPILVSSI